MHKIGESRVFLGRLLGQLLKSGLPLIGNAFKPLAKSVLIPLGLTAKASATDAAIHKKMFGFGHPYESASRSTKLIISDEKINDIMKVVKSLKDSGLLIKVASETIKNEVKKQKGRSLNMLLGILGASLLENLVTGKGTIRAGEGTARAGQDF